MLFFHVCGIACSAWVKANLCKVFFLKFNYIYIVVYGVVQNKLRQMPGDGPSATFFNEWIFQRGREFFLGMCYYNKAL